MIKKNQQICLMKQQQKIQSKQNLLLIEQQFNEFKQEQHNLTFKLEQQNLTNKLSNLSTSRYNDYDQLNDCFKNSQLKNNKQLKLNDLLKKKKIYSENIRERNKCKINQDKSRVSKLSEQSNHDLSCLVLKDHNKMANNHKDRKERTNHIMVQLQNNNKNYTINVKHDKEQKKCNLNQTTKNNKENKFSFNDDYSMIKKSGKKIKQEINNNYCSDDKQNQIKSSKSLLNLFLQNQSKSFNKKSNKNYLNSNSSRIKSFEKQYKHQKSNNLNSKQQIKLKQPQQQINELSRIEIRQINQVEQTLKYNQTSLIQQSINKKQLTFQSSTYQITISFNEFEKFRIEQDKQINLLQKQNNTFKKQLANYRKENSTIKKQLENSKKYIQELQDKARQLIQQNEQNNKNLEKINLISEFKSYSSNHEKNPENNLQQILQDYQKSIFQLKNQNKTLSLKVYMLEKRLHLQEETYRKKLACEIAHWRVRYNKLKNEHLRAKNSHFSYDDPDESIDMDISRDQCQCQ